MRLPLAVDLAAASTAATQSTYSPGCVVQKFSSTCSLFPPAPSRNGFQLIACKASKMGDGTLHTDEQLRRMTHAPTRVRFQFRQDAEGELQVYGIHTKATGDDSVRTVQAKWNVDKTAIEANLNGITILWTRRRGALGSLEPLIYPDNSDARLGTILVHPIPDSTDSQIEGLPGEDITTDDCIVVPGRYGPEVDVRGVCSAV